MAAGLRDRGRAAARGPLDRAGAARPRLLLWPEAAVTEPLEDGRSDQQALAQFERTRAAAPVGPGEYLLTGGLAVFSRDGRWIDGAANSIFVLGPGGQVVGRYDKAHLVPLRRISADAAAAVGDRPVAARARRYRLQLRPGPAHARPARLGQGRRADLLRDHLLGRGGRPRATAPTSSSIRRTTPGSARWGPPQHLAQARLRAIEEGLPIIRSTPTGISRGDRRPTARSSRRCRGGTAGAIDAPLPPPAPPTLFARFGNLIPLAACASRC